MHEGVGATIFQSQVAIHALEMQKLGYDVEVWTFETTLRHLASSRRNLAAAQTLGPVRVRLLRGVFVFLPLSDVVNAFILWYHLWRASAGFDLVHARTDYSAAVYSYVAPLVRHPVIWDCRGDAYPETEQALAKRRNIPPFVRRQVLRAIRRHERRAGAACTVANFVSRSLAARKARSLHGQPTFVIPCAVSSRYFYFDPSLREQCRADLGYASDDVVLVYSGALSTYQGFEDYVELIRRAVDAGNARVRLLVVTPDRERAREYIGDHLSPEVYQLHAASYADMNAYLNAADYGMLLRKKSPINDVASPTKFGEYCLAGLPVILDGNVDQTIEISTAIGNCESCAEVAAGKRLERPSTERREAIARRAAMYYGRERLNAEYARMYKVASTDGSKGPHRSTPRIFTERPANGREA